MVFALKGLATDAIYINDSYVLNPPPIDAKAFLNRSTFVIDSTNSLYAYQTLNTASYTNTSSGVMSSVRGFQFLTITNATKKICQNFVNQGSIDGGPYLEIQATNFFNSGPMSVNSQGTMLLGGKSMMLNFNGLRAGDTNNLDQFSQFCSLASTWRFSTNYFDDVGIADVYAGAGTNNYLNNQGPPVNLAFLAAAMNPPSVRAPFHYVLDSRFAPPFNTNFIFNLGGSNYTAFVYSNQVAPNRTIIQMVMVQTNFTATNVSADVRFYDDGFTGSGGTTVAVAYKVTDFDVVLQRYTTNSVYLVDSLASDTNVFLARNFFTPNTRRPSTMTVTTFLPCEYTDGFPTNTGYSPSLISSPTYASNTVRVLYDAYMATVNSGPGGTTNYVNPLTLPGIIQISGDTLSLNQTRIRAENTISIKTANLVSNKVAKVDAPYLIYDLTSVTPEMVISNLAPSVVNRVAGSMAAWSAIWKNFQTNGPTVNELDFHLLVVQNGIQFSRAAQVDTLLLKAPAVVIADNVNVSTSFKIDTTDLTVRGGLSLPPTCLWAGTNVLNLLNYTNRGTVNISRASYYGSDRAIPLDSFVNYGTNNAASHQISTHYFENQGCLQSSNGSLFVTADTAKLIGVTPILITNVFTNIDVTSTNVVTNVISTVLASKLVANGDVQLTANDLVLSNATVQAGVTAPVSLTLSAANRLQDSGQQAINRFYTTAGINVITRPALSDLLATYVTCVAAENSQSFNTWSGDDLGATTAGFTNNLAIGKLTLDGGNFSLFRFGAPEGQTGKALYVDYLELLNNATNFLTGALSIDPSLTIYFANANVAATKLDKSNGGRIRWVKSFAGPLSSTNIVYPSGKTYTFNVALVTEKNLDSDCDGIVNANDPTPIYTGEQALLTAVHSSSNKVTLGWTAICGAGTFLESKTSFSAPAWQTLTQFTNTGLVNSNVTYIDTTSNSFKIYRLRVNPPQP
jgi:hypothetical protein